MTILYDNHQKMTILYDIHAFLGKRVQVLW